MQYRVTQLSTTDGESFIYGTVKRGRKIIFIGTLDKPSRILDVIVEIKSHGMSAVAEVNDRDFWRTSAPADINAIFWDATFPGMSLLESGRF